MSNSLATVQVSASYTDPDNQRAALARSIVDAPYTGQSHNGIDVSAGATLSTVYDVDFGSVGDAATLVVVRNLTANPAMPAGQDLIVNINGVGPIFNLPSGGFIAIGMALAPDASPITSMTLTTTADPQVGPGKISTHVFGDPEAP